ncbi:MAG: ABC transporter permease [Nonlabens sp.]
MIKNYIKIAFRNLWKYRGYSALNIVGLAVGIACAGLIFLWIENEMSYNDSIADKELVYAIPTNQKYEGEWRTFFEATPGPLAQALLDDVPEVAQAARLRNADLLFSVGDNSIQSNTAYADHDIFEIFSHDFVLGERTNAFKNQKSIVITKEVAANLFGNYKSALGQDILINKNETFKVTGVIEDIPSTSTYGYTSFVPFTNFTDGKEWTQGYDSNFTDTFVKLKPNAHYQSVNDKVRAVLPSKTDDAETEAILFSANDWHLRNEFGNGKIVGGQIEYVQLFGFIALIILVIACINFMNISTARSEKRANEVGMRKALGSSKRQLIFQFLTESVMTAAIAGAVSVLILFLVIPEFNALLDAQISLDLASPAHLSALIGVVLICGLFAGVYPAFYLSSFKPVSVLKGAFSSKGSAALIRKGLVVAQFSVSIIFIISTILVYQQIQHIKDRDLGIDKDNLMEVPYSGNIIENFELIQQDLINEGIIESAGLSNSQILSGGNNTSGITWDGKPESADVLISFRTITKDLFNTTGMKIIEGKGFSPTEEQDSSSILISKSFAKLLDTDQVVGSTVMWSDWQLTVKGVVDDFVYGDMNRASDPVLFYHQAEGANFLYLKPVEDIDTKLVISKIEEVLKVHNEGYPFEYRFVDDAFNARFQSENLIGKLSRIFALLAIIISCLGLFGLSAYTAQQRRKEIGVRKVLGSSVANIVKLLSLDFIKLIGIAVIIAIPVGYYVMESWLQDYSYRIEINYWIFVLAAVAALAIAIITVSFQAIKAAIANPVNSLRSE